MGSSRLSIQCTAHINQRHIDILLRESQTEKKPSGPRADNDDLRLEMELQGNTLNGLVPLEVMMF